MPIYLYKCGQCNQTNEYLVSSQNQMPQRCSNEDCEAPVKDLTRVFDGQTFGAVTGTSPNKSQGSSSDLEVKYVHTCKEHGVTAMIVAPKNVEVKFADPSQN